MNSIKTIMLLTYIVLGCVGCGNNLKEVPIKHSNTYSIFNTPYFDDYFKLYKDSSFAKFAITRHFSLIGEGGFLDPECYDSYIVLTITENWQPLKVFVIKRKDGITIMSYKEVLGERWPSSPADKIVITNPYNITTKSRIFQNDLAVPFKKLIDHMAIKKPELKDWHIRERFLQLYYLNNKTYLYVIEDFLSHDELRTLESMFIHQVQFKELMNLDSVINYDTP